MSLDDRRARGIALYADQFGLSVAEVENHFVETYGKEFAEEAFQATGGAAWENNHLDLRVRSLVVLASLATLGGVESRIRNHTKWALRHGATVEEIRSVMALIANYAGFARASVAMEAVNAALAEG
jgi:alkylhydroperoxidase/carboxymuconolactone decarboxylase family protein YurZ